MPDITNPSHPKIAILMCTYNGAEYLAEQIESIHAQGVVNIDIWVSDDGSSDNTVELLHKYQQSWNKGRFEILQGSGKCFATNFQSLVCNDDIKADYYSYADQDDIWQPDKLSRAMTYLKNKQVPALYCSRTRLIDGKGKDMQQCSPLFSKPPSFTNALVQNIAGGNTMVMNHQARQLLVSLGIKDVVCHDWWTYIIISGSGGFVYYDAYPTTLYRQHEQNEIGASLGWSARITRLKMLLKGSFKNWNTLHIRALHANTDLLSTENKEKLKYFVQARECGLFKRLYLIKKSGVYRQSFFANMAFYVAVVINKI